MLTPFLVLLFLPAALSTAFTPSPSTLADDVVSLVSWNATSILLTTSTPSLHLYEASTDGSLTQGDPASLGLDVGGATVLAAGDLNGDGHADVAACLPSALSVHFFDANTGTFGAGLTSALPSCGTLVVCDMDGDGVEDVVVGTVKGITVFLSGTTQVPVDDFEDPLGGGSAVSALAVADFNNDGALDVFTGTGVLVNSRVVFDPLRTAASINVLGDAGVDGGVAADVDGDGATDLLVAYGSTAVAWGPITSAPLSTTQLAASSATAMLCHDFDLDGIPDVFLTVGGVPVFLGGAGGRAFTDRSTAMGLPAGLSRGTVATAFDAQADGDLDIVFTLNQGSCVNDPFTPCPHLNDAVLVNDAVDTGASWMTVFPQHANGAAAQASMVRVTCATGCGSPWSTAAIAGTSGPKGAQSQRGAWFGIPPHQTGARFDVEAVYYKLDDGAVALLDKTNVPSLGGVPANTTLIVQVRPFYVEAGVDPPSGMVTLGSNLTIALTASEPHMVPAPGCCLVNGVPVDTLTPTSPTTFILSYTPAAGDPQWPADGLQVTAPLVSTAGVSMSDAPLALVPSPAGDTVPPVLRVVCRPPAVSASSTATVCLECDVDVCAFSVVVGGAPVPPSTSTNSSATLHLGPFATDTAVALVATASDANGTQSAAVTVHWVVDTEAPTASVLLSEPAITPSRSAVAQFDCDDPRPCTFRVQLDDDPPATLRPTDSNSTEAHPWRLATSLTGRPPKVLLDGAVVKGAEFAVLEGEKHVQVDLPPMSPGPHTLTVDATGADAAAAVPLVYDFVVDAVAPVVTAARLPTTGAPVMAPTAVFSVSEPGSVFHWQVNASGGVVGGASPAGALDLTPLGLGAGMWYTLEVWAVDAASDVVRHTWAPGAAECDDPPGVELLATAVGGAAAWLLELIVEDPAWAEGFELRVGGGEWACMSPLWTVVDAPQGVPVTAEARPRVAPVCPPAAASSADLTTPAALPGAVRVVSRPATSVPFGVPARFELENENPLGGVECRLAVLEPWAPCDGEFIVLDLPVGAHDLLVRPVDGGSPTVLSWVVTDSSGVLFVDGLAAGPHTIAAVAFDQAGNQQPPPNTTTTWVVDPNPPRVTAELLTPSLSSSPSAAVNATCWGEAPGTCSLCWAATVGVLPPDGCSVNDTLAFNAPDGPHSVAVHAVDAAGLSSEAVEVVWEVDTVPPRSSLSVAAGVAVGNLTVVTSSPATVAVTSPDASTLAVSANGVLVATTAGNVPLTIGPGVASVVQAQAVDAAGNVEVPPATLSVVLDNQAPTAAFVVVPPPVTRLPTVTAVVHCVDDIAGPAAWSVTARRVGGGVVAANTSTGPTVVVDGLPTGVYTLEYGCEDNVGNANTTALVTSLEVDTIPPVTSLLAPLPPYTPAPAVALAFTVSEPGVTRARINGGPWVPTPLANLSEGAAVVELQSVDVAGNEELPPFAQTSTVVDYTPPPLHWVDAPPPPFTPLTSTPFCVVVGKDLSPVSASANGAPLSFAGNTSCSSVTAAGDGPQLLSVAAVDAAGNGATLTAGWHVDTLQPVLTVVGDLAATSPTCSDSAIGTMCSSRTVAVHVSCNDTSPCSLAYTLTAASLDAGGSCDARRLSAPDLGEEVVVPPGVVEVTTPSDGLFVLGAIAVDAAGNLGSGSNATFAWGVDTQPAVEAPVIEDAPLAVTASTSAVFVVRTEDDSPGQTRFWYTLDGGMASRVPAKPIPNTAPVVLSVLDLAPGAHLLALWSVDQAGHSSPQAFHSWFVSLSSPRVRVLSGPAQVSGDPAPVFELQSYWPETPPVGANVSVAITVSLGSGEETACGSVVAANGTCAWSTALGSPQPYAMSTQAVLDGAPGTPTVYSWEYRECSDAQFAEFDAHGGLTCVDCPSGANCEGGLTAAAGVVARAGHWAPAAATRFYACPVADACLPGVPPANGTAALRSRCASGYTGTLCGVCDAGHFPQFGRCGACGNSDLAWLVSVGIVVGLGVAVGAVFLARHLLPVATVKVLLSFLQIVASASTSYTIPWPAVFRDFLDACQLFLVDVIAVARVSCSTPLSFFDSLVMTLVLFKAVALVVVFVPVASAHLRRQRTVQRTVTNTAARRFTRATPGGGRASRRRSTAAEVFGRVIVRVQTVDWAKVFKGVFLYLFVAYPGVSLKILKTFHCVEVEGDHWLVADMRLKCYDGEWFGYAVYAATMGALFTAGLPLAITVILWRHRNALTDAGVVARWGFLYESYGAGAYLWEVEELLRKLWLSSVAVLLAGSGALQVTAAVLVSGWAHVLHAVYKPWRGVEDGAVVYGLQHGGLLVTCFVFLMGLLFQVEGVEEGSRTQDALAWAMVWACVGVCVAGTVLVAHGGVARFRALRATRKPVEGAATSPPKFPPRRIRAVAAGGAPTGWTANPMVGQP